MLSKFYGKIMETAQKCWHTFQCTCTAVHCTQLLKGIILANDSFINVVVFFHSLLVFGTFFDINARSFYRTQVCVWSCFCSILCYMVQMCIDSHGSESPCYNENYSSVIQELKCCKLYLSWTLLHYLHKNLLYLLKIKNKERLLVKWQWTQKSIWGMFDLASCM